MTDLPTSDMLTALAPARAALVARLADLKSNGTAMIGVFHHPDDVAQLIDRVIDLSPDALTKEEREDVAV